MPDVHVCCMYFRCELDASELAPYFSIGSCMEGLCKVFNSLFDVTLTIEATEYGELWSNDIIKLVS